MKRIPTKEINLYELPFGYIDETGKVHKSFGLRPLTGKIRKSVGQRCKGKAMLAHLHTALQEMLTHIGDIENPPYDVIRSLTTKDRDHILFVARLMDDPEEKNSRPCARCGFKVGIEVDLVKDTEYQQPEERDAVVAKDGRGHAFWTYTYANRKDLVDKAQLRLPTAGDEEDLTSGDMRKMDPEDIKHRLLERVILDLNGRGPLRLHEIEDLEAKTIDALKARAEDQQFGVDTELTTDCPGCGNEEGFSPDLVSRFLGVGRQRATES